MSWFRTMLHRVGVVGWNVCTSGCRRGTGVAHRRCSPPCAHLPPCPAAPLQEPVIVWSFIIGGVGLGLPLVVPPIREAMGYNMPAPKTPPPVRQVRALCVREGCDGQGKL